ncbi:RHOMBOID-like protein 12, mitochondrial [Pistacia vera]|uniref:RHOMBOID-like protein 12, mitochondrial n=1 Tax=Pistacia vera TaxID=55513 RepID=UPI0012630AB2|nr:RHOMBOID-like protein 12, mitochondrial [Pistacia vera]
MQRILKLKQLASNFPKAPINTTTFSNSLTTIKNPLFSSFSRHPFHSNLSWSAHHTLPLKADTFLFNPLLVQRSFLCFSSTQMRKCLFDCKVLFLRAQLPKRSFQFTPSSRSSGWRSWFHRLTANDVVLGLIITNVAVFLLWRIADQSFMVKNFTVSLDNVLHGRVHTMITSAFSHVDMEHIVSNMIGLYFFGMNIGNTLGPEYLLKLYLAGAIGGSVFYLVHHAFLAMSSKGQGMWQKDPSRTPALGASGAVNAIMLLNIFLNPKATIYLDFIIPVPAMLLGVFLIGKDVLRIVEGNSNISGSAHLGGVAVAAIAWARIRRGLF